MPPTINEPTPVDEPQAIHDPPLPNPAIDDSNIKAMSEKFRSLLKPADPAPAAQPPAAPAAPAKEPAVAPAANEPAKASNPPQDEPDVPANAPVTRENFKRLTQARDSFKAQAEQFKKQQEELASRAKSLEEELTKTKSALPPNLEDIQKSLADAKRLADENKRITEELETINLERSPRFQNWWKTETGKHIKVAQAHVPAEHREEMAKLLLAPPSPERDAAIDEILEPLSSTSRRLASGALEAIESLRIQREEALTQGSVRYKELQAYEQAEREKQMQAGQQKLEALTQKALASSKAYGAFRPTGEPEHDSMITQREAFIRACLQGKVEEDVMVTLPAIAMEHLHMTEKVIPGLKAEIAKQADLIKQLQSAGPRAGDGSGRAASAPAEPKDGTSFAARVRALYPGKSPS